MVAMDNTPKKYSGYTLGLDLGTASIGWALIKTDFEETINPDTEKVHLKTLGYSGFLDTKPYRNAPELHKDGQPAIGVRVFAQGMALSSTGSEQAPAQARRTARSARRVTARRKARRDQMRDILITNDFLPSDEKQREVLLTSSDPYALRAKSLDEKLSEFELGTILFQLCQHRGFKSNRKSASDKEDQGIKAEMSGLQKDIDAQPRPSDSSEKCRTLGEYLYAIGSSTEYGKTALNNGLSRLRNRHTRRVMYQHEFAAIVKEQSKHHPILSKLKEYLNETIFFQHSYEVTPERREKAGPRANLHRSPQVKPCPLEKGERGCPKATWVAQRFRILKEVNNLKINNRDGSKSRELTKEERAFTVDLLSRQKTLGFSSLATKLAKEFDDVSKDATFNLDCDVRDNLKGNEIDYFLSKLIGDGPWDELDGKKRDILRDKLVNDEDPESIEALFAQFDVDLKKLHSFDIGAADGYMAFSEKALKRILPHLENGLQEHYAIVKEYPKFESSSASAMSFLPYLQGENIPHQLKDITNPNVTRALTELRKVVNAIVREYGLPDQIVVELTRELKRGKEAKKDHSKFIKDNTDWRETSKPIVEDLGGNPHSRDDLLKYKLWCDQAQCCLYSGKTIPQSSLFSHSEVELDHILPHWQSMDDSQSNKVLVYRSENADKGQQTIPQWLGETSPRYKTIIKAALDATRRSPGGLAKYIQTCESNGLAMLDVARATSRTRGKNDWAARLRKLMQAEVNTDVFSRRQLTDTGHLSRAAVRYLELLYPETRRSFRQDRERKSGKFDIVECAVLSSRGGLTADLRHHWGLNGIFKNADSIFNIKGEAISRGEDGKKIRIDHRHHAIDAIAVAMSSRSAIQQLQTYFRESADLGRDQRPEISYPWDSFRSDTAKALGEIIVSHRVQRRARGSFHEDTAYGKQKDKEGNVIEGRYVFSKSITSIDKTKQLDEIISPASRQAIVEAAMRGGWDGEKKALPKDWWVDKTLPWNCSREGVALRNKLTGHNIDEVLDGIGFKEDVVKQLNRKGWNQKSYKLPKDWWINDVLMPNGMPLRKVRVSLKKDPDKMLEIGDRLHKNVVKGNNHHILFQENGSGDDKKLLASVVPVVVAADRTRRKGVPAVNRNVGDGNQFVMSLSAKEMVVVRRKGKGPDQFCVMQKVSGGSTPQSGFNIILREHRDSRPASDGNKSPFFHAQSSRAWGSHSITKVQIDPIGRAFSAGD